jgi:hypothetical protein
MPLSLPNLDDRSYTDLIEEALAMIPAHAPEWTNHNPSDPGITLIELFAYLSEMLIYRLNRVTPENVLAFLRLLNGNPSAPGTDWREELAQHWRAKTPEERARLIAETIRQHRRKERAVTRADFERLALDADRPRVARARCLPGANGAQRLIVLVKDKLVKDKLDDKGYFIKPRADVETAAIKAVKEDLEPRCLLTTRLQVQAAKLCTVGVRLTAKLASDAVASKVIDDATRALRRFLDPLLGGENGKGWPFGRAVYVSELYGLLDALPGVEYLEPSVGPGKKILDEVIVSDSAKRILIEKEKQKRLIAITLEENEVVYLDPAQTTIDVK